MVSRPLVVVHRLADRALQALDHLKGEKVPTVGRHLLGLGRLDEANAEMHLPKLLPLLHPGMKASWGRLGSGLCQLDRLGGRRPLVDASKVDDALEEEEANQEADLLEHPCWSMVDRPEEDGWAHSLGVVLHSL